MLLEIAVADAYGAGFEFADPTPDRVNDASRHVQHPRHMTVRPGLFTDDTQMSDAVASCVLAGRTTREDFAEAFVTGFKRDWRDGYARGFQAFLESVTDGADFLGRIKPDSDKSGAAMRVGPIGLLGSVEEVLRVATLQARLTHDTPEGTGAAQGAALMVHHQVRGLRPH
jgi:ADP-ribosylglycohydrolase